MSEYSALNTLWGSKVDIAIERLGMFEPPEGYWLAFSGGKDSQTIYHLAQEAGVKFEAHFSVTTVDPPELLAFIKTHYPDVIWDRPEKSMFRLIVTYGLPTRLHRFCCKTLKECGGDGHLVLTGIRWAESARRAKRPMTENCYRGKYKTYLHPIIDWSDADVWSYLGTRPHCELYDQGYKRIGCVMCPMKNKERLKDAERWPRIARMYRMAAERYWERKDWTGKVRPWQSAQEMYDWWLSEPEGREDEAQMVMFE